jgi:hypothetical protein
MYVLAILTLAGSVEDEAVALGADLGSTAYETRLVLAAGTPAVVLQTADKERVRFLLARLQSRGHGAVACDDTAVAASADMIPVDGFSFEPGALVNGDGARLAFANLLAILPALHRRQYEGKASPDPDPMKVLGDMANGPGGGFMLRQVRKITAGARQPATTHVEERESVLYLFSRGNPRPWLLREGGTSYAGLGPRLLPTQRENFQIMTELLRDAAPQAIYDDRLLALRRFPDRTHGGRSEEGPRKLVASSTNGVDLAAHLLAMWSSRRR